ncbi:hypothetical protein CPHO_00725 [Corynebacterium phocae]|uniref:Uncharacterized protein n=1 Tax=Corynebacterium phocae TaxID=161895 RepID=A0A1L7D0Y5_9CORY|nr:hypothetical protein CPHO_00725 [Corynebacterium phocae]
MNAGAEEIDVIAEEFIGRLGPYAILFQLMSGKIPLVLSNNYLRSRPDRCRQNMPVIRVWKAKSWDKILVAGHETIIYRLTHEIAGSVESHRI